MQHPRERFHPLGTARIARLGLHNVHVEVAPPRGGSTPASLPAGAGLLFPGPGSRDLATLLPHEQPDTLVVIDGTWAHARTLYRDHAWLQRLPHYRLTPRRESRYRLRKEPAAEYVSTIEAIVDALHILEPATPGLDELLDSFEAMIDQQLALIQRHHSGPRQRSAPPTVRGIPRWILSEPERIVVMAFEAAPRGSGGLALLQCVALRMATGEVFQRFVRPPEGRFPSPRHLEHMGLSAELLSAGSTTEQLQDGWSRFVQPTDIAVAWTITVLETLGATVGLPARRLHLKSAYRSHAKRMPGSLTAVLERLQLKASVPRQLRGRAGRHVAEVATLLTHLQGQSGGGPRRRASPSL